MKGGHNRKSVLTGITSLLIVLFTMHIVMKYNRC